MLKEFIEGNKLKAKIVQGHCPGARAKCRLFVTDTEEILIVALKSSSIDFEKVKAVLGKAVEPAPEGMAMEMTGYLNEFLPPVSIYGVKVLLDERVEEKGTVVCPLSTVSSLEIPVSEIKDFNDDLVVVDIIKKGELN